MPDSVTPTVSVVVLTWNRRGLLAETLESVLGQTYSDLEVLVIDNESEDDTEQYVESLGDERVRYFCHANGGNLSVNRNFALERARGDWIAFCDDDDLWLPGKLEAQMAEIGRHPDTALVSTNAIYFDDDEEYGLLVPSGGSRTLELDDFFALRNPVVLSSVLVSRTVLEDVGPFDEDPAVFTIEDVQLWMKVAARGLRIAVVDEPLVRYRVHGSMTSHRDSRTTIDKEIAMLRGLGEQEIIDDAALERGVTALEQKRRRAGMKEMLKRMPGMKRAVYKARSTRAGREQGDDG